MKFEVVKFIRNKISIKMSDTDIFIEIPAKSYRAPFDIIVSIFEQNFQFNDFTDFYLEDFNEGNNLYRAKILIIKQSELNQFCTIIGINKVIFVSYQKKLVQEILTLNRKYDDDESFYFMKVLLLKDSFIIIYEGGVCRINELGNILWHTLLMWDDIYLKLDDKNLYYSSEFGEFAPNNWVISIETGEKSQLN